jgi:hypothetical protein
MMDLEDPVHFAKRIGVRYPLAVAPDGLKQSLAASRVGPRHCSMTAKEYCAKKSWDLNTPTLSSRK